MHYNDPMKRASTYFVYPTPHGPVTIGVADGAVCAVALGEERMPGTRKPTELSNACANQLLEYFAGKRTAFDVPIAPKGTAFQQDVWRALQNIPYGQARTYSEVAEAAGHPDAYRMVGSAVKKNPLAVIVPAHRVIGANGHVVGTDRHAQLRAAFLELERRNA